MKKIIWEKWIDPTRPMVYPENHLKSEEIDPLTEAEQDIVDTFPLNKININKNKDINLGPVLVSDAGIIPLFESNIPSKLYNFWMGHTNFRITKPLLNKILNTNGIEECTPFSPYRFRIAIGKAFKNPKQIRKNIEKALGANIKKEKSKLSFIEARLTKENPYWARVILNDNTYDFVVGTTELEVLERINSIDKSKILKVEYSWKK